MNEPTNDQLEHAWNGLRVGLDRHRPFASAMADPILARLVHARALQLANPRATTSADRLSSPIPALRVPTMTDRKRAAAGDFDD